MRVIIAGAGETGLHLAKTLSSENIEVIVIDADHTRLQMLSGYNLMTMSDSPLSLRTLENCGIHKTDMFIALTPSETENVVLSIMAKSMGARCTVARINGTQFLDNDCDVIFREKGVDYMIYPEQLAVQEVAMALRHPWSRHWSELCDGKLIVAGAKIVSGSRLCNLMLKDFGCDASDFHVSALKRGRETIIPNGNTVMKDGDIAYISTTTGCSCRLNEIFGYDGKEINKIMVVGGSRIGRTIARTLCNDYDIMIVEQNPVLAQKLAAELPAGVSVSVGDGRSIEFLESESIGDYDAYIALTEFSEANIIGCQIAKGMGVPKAVVKTVSIDLVAEAEKLGISTVLNKNLLCSGRIHQILLDAREEKCMSLEGADITVMNVSAGSRITRHMVKDLKIPVGITFAGMVRDGAGMMVDGNTQFKEGDTVAVFSLSGTLRPVKKLFE